MKTLVAVALTAAAALAAASPASGHTIHISDDGRSRISVPYGDLNLASPAGVQTLEGRLRAAARAFCGTPTAKGFVEAREIGDCRRNVMEVARPQLLALNRGKGSIALAGGR